MEHIVDLHIHSHYARATSKDMNSAGIYSWSKIKGIGVVGTGDITHPAWFREVSEKLEQTDEGLYQLKPSFAKKLDTELPETVRDHSLRFIPTVEISTIYSKNGKVRKIHQVVVLPDLQAVARLNAQLAKIGNLRADGRPTLGLDSKELLKIVLNISQKCLVIPAHIWTPWFGIFGSQSGFDSLAEAYEEFSDQITAIETGLSSDPAMNWNIPELQTKSITSHSDAHSPQKLGREATLIVAPLSYDSIISAIRTNDNRLVGTIEFYPQEGKYHYDGHRNCKVCYSPSETAKHKGLCPICGKRLTIGVVNRVEELSHPNSLVMQKKVEYIVPLAELIALSLGIKSTSSLAVQRLYSSLISQFGDEFTILRTVPLRLLRNKGFDLIANAVEHMRNGTLIISPGFDGVYGSITFPSNTSAEVEQLGLGF